MTPQRQAQLGRWLITAISRGRVNRVQELLRLGADPNTRTPYGSSALHVAAQSGNDTPATLIEVLLRHGAAVHARDSEGATPMFRAAQYGNEAAIRTLQEFGGNINDQNTVLDTALTFACCWGETSKAEMLLNLGMDLHVQDDGGMDALMWAAKGGHAETIALLLRHGADPNHRDLWGSTALMRAARSGSAHSVALLLNAGADPHVRTPCGVTALDEARRYAGRDLLTAMLAETPSVRLPLATQRTVTRTPSATGEVVITIEDSDENGGGSSFFLCDGFDAIVAMLEPGKALEASAAKAPSETVGEFREGASVTD